VVVGVTHLTGVYVDPVAVIVADRRAKGQWLSQQEELDHLADLHQRRGFSWPFWIDGKWPYESPRPDARTANMRSFGVYHLPAFALIDRAGKLQHLHLGVERIDEMDAVIKRLLAEPRPPREK
jgi:hypothetical protein